jgi:hypothetical protein
MLSRWLQQFRQAIYKNLCKAQDATFELMDALLLTRKAQSLADLYCPVSFAASGRVSTRHYKIPGAHESN